MIVVIVVVAIAFFTSLYIIHRDDNEYVTYTLDPANSCSYQNGQVASSSEVGYNGKAPTITIKKSNQAAFIKHAEATGECAYLYPAMPR